jgi:hypothetical protein
MRAAKKYVLRQRATRNKACSQHSSHGAGRGVNNELNYFVSRTSGHNFPLHFRYMVIEKELSWKIGGCEIQEVYRLMNRSVFAWSRPSLESTLGAQPCHLVERVASSRLIRFVDGWCRCHCGVQLYPCYPGLDTALALGLLVARLSIIMIGMLSGDAPDPICSIS